MKLTNSDSFNLSHYMSVFGSIGPLNKWQRGKVYFASIFCLCESMNFALTIYLIPVYSLMAGNSLHLFPTIRFLCEEQLEVSMWTHLEGCQTGCWAGSWQQTLSGPASGGEVQMANWSAGFEKDSPALTWECGTVSQEWTSPLLNSITWNGGSSVLSSSDFKHCFVLFSKAIEVTVTFFGASGFISLPCLLFNPFIVFCSCAHTWSRWPPGRCEQLAALSADCWTDQQIAAAGDPRARRRGGQSGSWTTDPAEWCVTTGPWTSPAPARAAVDLSRTHWQPANTHKDIQTKTRSNSKFNFRSRQLLHPLTSSSSGDKVSATFCLRRFLQKAGWSIRV